MNKKSVLHEKKPSIARASRNKKVIADRLNKTTQDSKVTYTSHMRNSSTHSLLESARQGKTNLEVERIVMPIISDKVSFSGSGTPKQPKPP